MPKIGYKPSFPATKYRNNEDLYNALSRIMTGNLGLSENSFFPETGLPMLKNRKKTIHYPGLDKDYHFYPVEISLNAEGWIKLADNSSHSWYTLNEIPHYTDEPNILAIAKHLSEITASDNIHEGNPFMGPVMMSPTMDALADMWARKNNEGVRKLEKNTILSILDAGNRAFNLRVADPYLPYQRQGLGFTWSFFTTNE